MTITSKLRLLSVVCSVLTLIISITILSAFQQLNEAIAFSNQADQLQSHCFELSALLHEYLSDHQERVITQWIAVSKNIKHVLHEIERHDNAIISSIDSNLEYGQNLFSELTRHHEEYDKLSETLRESYREFEYMLSGQLLIRIQRMTYETNKLQQRANDQLVSIQRKSWLIVLGVVGIVIGIVIGTFGFVRRALTRPIIELQNKITHVAKGQFLLPAVTTASDEIGQLSRAFNEMSRELEVRYIALEGEIRERQKAEEQLRQAYQEIEQLVAERTAELQRVNTRLMDEIEDRKRIEETLRTSEAFLNSIIEHSPHAMWISDPYGTLIRLNQACRDLLHITDDEVVGKYNVFQDTIVAEQGHLPSVKQVYQQGKIARFTIIYDSTRLEYPGFREHVFVVLDTTISPVLDVHGRVVHAIIQHVDITDRKRAEEQINAALQEKEVLLREIHHRVKNNLMVVISLIQMQAEQTSEPTTLALFRDLHNRVLAMAMVHEDLYQSKNLARIEFGTYLERLVINIRSGFAKTDAAIKIDAADILLDIHYAIPCGLIVAELATNAFKYAFPPGRRPKSPSQEGKRTPTPAPSQEGKRTPTPGPSQEGKRTPTPGPSQEGKRTPTPGPSQEGNNIRVEMRTADDTYTLIVSDNGVGLPPEFDIQTSRTLGMTLVRSWVVHQLKGKIDVNRQSGAKFIITF